MQFSTERGQHGAALLLVVWVVALLALLAATALQLVVDAGKVGEGMRERARLTAAADGAVQLSVEQLLQQDQAAGWRPDSTPRTLDVGGITVTVVVADEGGKLNLNRAPEGLLLRLLRAVGATPAEASRWAAAMTPGANSAAGATAPSAFHSVNEATARAGIPSALLECLQPMLTVYGETAGVDLRYASSTLRQALRTDGEPDQARESGTNPVSLAGHVLMIEAEASDEQAAFISDTVLRLTGDPRYSAMIAAREQGFHADSGTAGCHQAEAR